MKCARISHLLVIGYKIVNQYHANIAKQYLLEAKQDLDHQKYDQ